MLKANQERQFEFNKIAALDSARGMITRYHIIRPVQGFQSLVCKIIDFQVLIAAMLLILNRLGRSIAIALFDGISNESREPRIGEAMLTPLSFQAVQRRQDPKIAKQRTLETMSFSLPLARRSELPPRLLAVSQYQRI